MDENDIQPRRMRLQKSFAPSCDPTSFQIQAVSGWALLAEEETALLAAEGQKFLAG